MVRHKQLPFTVFISHRVAREVLGITKYRLRKLIQSGKVRVKHFNEGDRGMVYTEDIYQVIAEENSEN